MPTNQKRQWVEVTCSNCHAAWLKRKESIAVWKGYCKVCAQKFIVDSAERKESRRQTGLKYVAKYGPPCGPKMENRPRGKTHWHWRKSFKGADAPNWRGGLTSKHELLRHSLEYRLFREAVFRRDDYACVACKDNKGGNLNADHIKPFALFPELRFVVSNARTLCKTCHRKYGAKVTSTGKSIRSSLPINGSNWVGA